MSNTHPEEEALSLSQARQAFVPRELQQRAEEAAAYRSSLLQGLARRDDRWSGAVSRAASQLAGSDALPGADRYKQACSRAFEAELAIERWLAEQLSKGALIAYGRSDRFTGPLVRINADAWSGTIYVFGTYPGKRPKANFDFSNGCVRFLGEKVELFDVRIGRPRPSQTTVPEGAASPNGAAKGRPGPKPGEVDRFGESDRALYPDLDRMIAEEKITITAAARRLADEGRIDGVGSPHSRATRLATKYRKERGLSNGPRTH